ncbi:MAG: tetratricopeptide (TPR) repeat protein, partial [Phycisphaerales bacterium]
MKLQATTHRINSIHSGFTKAMAKKKKAYSKQRRPQRKRQNKANTKLIKVIAFALAFLLLVGGGAWIYVEMRGATTNISAGDAQFAEGEYKQAWKSYGRAVRKEPNNLEYIRKVKNAVTQFTPVTQAEARQMYDEYIRTLIHEARYNPLDIDTHLAIAKEIYTTAYLTGQDSEWLKLRSVVKTGLDRISPADPRSHELILYRGLASLRIEDASMTDTYDAEGNVRFPGESDFEEVLEKDSGNALAWASLAHGRMAVYYRLSDEGKTSQAKTNKLFAASTMEQAKTLAGESFDVSAVVLREYLLQRTVLLQKQLVNAGEVKQGEIDDVTTKIVSAREKVIASYDANLDYARAGEMATLFMATDNDGDSYTIDLLQVTVELHPNDFGRMYMLAGLLAKAGEKDAAQAVFLKILETPRQVVGIHAIELFTIQPMVAAALVRLHVEQAFSAETIEEELGYIEQAKEYREKLFALVSGNELDRFVLYADGIIAFAIEDYHESAVKLEEAIRRNPEIRADAYRQVAFALSKTGSNGLAIERIETAIEMEPSSLQNYIAKARIEVGMSNANDASQTLSVLPAEARNRPEVKELLDIIALQLNESGSEMYSDPVLQKIAESEKLNRKHEYEESIQLLSNAISQTPEDDWRLFAAMSNTCALNEDKEAAIDWIRKAIAIAPNPERLAPQLHVLQSGNAIEALISLIESKDWDEATKAEELSVSLYKLGMTSLGAASRWEQIGDDIEAADAREIADKAIAESVLYQERAQSLGADLSRITALRFNQHIAANDLEKAQEALDILIATGARQNEIDSSKISLLLAQASEAKGYGKLDIHKARCSSALAIAEQMTKDSPILDAAWRTYGRVLFEMGEFKSALGAYAEAYRIAPGDKENIRRYVGALFTQNDDPQRLLRILRTATNQYPSDKQFTSAWLESERLYGQVWKVIAHMMNEHALNPQNRGNALALAHTLATLEPTRELLRSLDGKKEEYSARVWEQMRPEMQESVLREARKNWDVLIAKILDSANSVVDANIRMATLHASVYRDVGKLDQASEVWETFIASYTNSEKYINAVIAAADFLHKASRTQQSIKLLNEAKAMQSDKFEIDAMLGSLYYAGGLYAEAAEYLKAPVDATSDPTLTSRRIEALALAGNFEEAEKAVEGLITPNDMYVNSMLRALIQRVKGEQALAQGNIVAGKLALKKYRDALHSALSSDAQNKTPYVKLCQSLLNEYQLTQEKSLLEEALQIAEVATGTGKQTEQFVIIKADVLQANGQLNKAVDRLMRFLSDNPNSDFVRQRLIEAHLDSENVDRALHVAKEGVALNPSSADWYRRLAELHLRANDDKGEAIKAYLEAVQREPTVQLLLRIEEVTRTNQELPNQELIDVARSSLAKLHPIAGAIEAKALMNLGRKREALIAMDRTWSILNSAIDNGWISPQSTGNWFLDVHEIFADAPDDGEAFVRALIGNELTQGQLAGLAGYYHAFGDDYIERSLQLIDEGLALPGSSKGSRVQLLMMRGGFLVELQRYEEGAEAFRLLSQESNSPLVQNNLAYVVGVYQDKPEKGLEIAKAAAKLAPRHVSIIDTVATLYHRLG